MYKSLAKISLISTLVMLTACFRYDPEKPFVQYTFDTIQSEHMFIWAGVQLAEMASGAAYTTETRLSESGSLETTQTLKQRTPLEPITIRAECTGWAAGDSMCFAGGDSLDWEFVSDETNYAANKEDLRLQAQVIWITAERYEARGDYAKAHQYMSAAAELYNLFEYLDEPDHMFFPARNYRSRITEVYNKIHQGDSDQGDNAEEVTEATEPASPEPSCNSDAPPGSFGAC